MSIKDAVRLKSKWKISKFKDKSGEIAKMLQEGASVEEVQKRYGKQCLKNIDEWEGNIGLNEGLGELIDIICGLGTPVKWDATNARLGVGNSNTAPVATQTALQGASKAFKAMDSTYPSRSEQTVTWRATFGTAEGNFAWEEYTVVNASDDTGKNLNRCIMSKGTKVSGETWTLELQITFA